MSVFGAPFWVSLLLILALRFIATAGNTASDLPCCCSVPIMAMGAVIGRILSLLFVRMGMQETLVDALMVVAMVTFFTTVVHAPMTGIIMTVELTWNFTFLLPAVLSVAMGYVVGGIFHTEPLYERLLDEMLEERKGRTEEITVRLRVREAAGKEIRNILWPFSALVTKIEREGAEVVPHGGTVLEEGDRITVVGRPEDAREYLSTLAALVGEREPEEEGGPSEPSEEDGNEPPEQEGPQSP